MLSAMSSVTSTKCNLLLLRRNVSRPTSRIPARKTNGNNRSTDLAGVGSLTAAIQFVEQTFLSAGSGNFPVASADDTDTGLESPLNSQAGKPAQHRARYPCHHSRHSSRGFDFELVTFDARTVQLCNDGVRVFGGDVHKQMPLADVHFAHNFSGQTGLARDGVHDVNRGDAHFLADVDMQARLLRRRAAVGFLRFF